jgi:hypothetical protein
MSGMRFSLDQLNPAMRQQVVRKIGLVKPVVPPVKPSKYRNVRVEFEGMTFDSMKELKRYQDLLLLEKAGKIADLKRQVPFSLCIRNEEIAVYRADFVYLENGKKRVEDVKGYKRGLAYRMFKMKAAMVKALYRVEVIEV